VVCSLMQATTVIAPHCRPESCKKGMLTWQRVNPQTDKSAMDYPHRLQGFATFRPCAGYLSGFVCQVGKNACGVTHKATQEYSYASFETLRFPNLKSGMSELCKVSTVAHEIWMFCSLISCSLIYGRVHQRIADNIYQSCIIILYSLI
jgi:hypothetical protein